MEYDRLMVTAEIVELTRVCSECGVEKPNTGQVRRERSYKSNRSRELKLETIRAYGSKCELCGETYPEFMTIDHIHGGGNKHRALVGEAHKFRSWLKQQGWPKDAYRLLCANCNCSKKRNGWTAESQHADFMPKV
jgi:hypothetical protein